MSIWSDITPEVRELKLPVLCVVGEDDPVYGPAYQRESVLSVFSHARMEVVPNCGHGLTLERPQEVAAILADYLASISGSSRSHSAG
jgi:pimeloyl-ACP methyl ester carboxylesterase